MTAFRSVVLTLQLLVLLVEMVLPLVSHQWMSARVWRTDAVIEIRVSHRLGVETDNVGTHIAHHALHHMDASAQPEHSSDTLPVWLITDAELWSHLLLLGVQLLLILGGSRSELYRPRTSVYILIASLIPTIDLPPPDVPPRLAHA